ncbi:MAG: hypothetical protein ABJZ55_20395 [Fuerstiella sp.]
MPSPIVTSDWQYAGFASQETVEQRLAMAVLHDAEVRRAAVEDGSGQGRYHRLAPNYITDLQKTIEGYRSENRMAEFIAARKRNARRPSGFRPRF